MSGLPISETSPNPIADPTIPYLGYGWSNQTVRTTTYPPLAVGADGSSSQLYVPDLVKSVGVLEEQVEIIEAAIIANPPVSVTPVGSAPNASAATVASSAITLQPADATNPGVITAGVQTIGGNKTFTGELRATAVSADPGGSQRTLVINTATNQIGSIVGGGGGGSGVTAVTAVGVAPNANAASIAGSNLTLQPASATFPGVVTAAAQTFGGTKTFSAITLPAASGLTGSIQQPSGTTLMHTASSLAGSNIFVGQNTGRLANTAAGVTGVGKGALQLLTTGSFNTVVGSDAMMLHTSGLKNVAIGSSVAPNSTICANNVFIGADALPNATSVGGSIIIGKNAGTGMTGEQGVIEIGNGTTGTSLTNSINIGMASTTQCYIRGISGVTPAAPTGMVIIDPSTHRLGQADYGLATAVFTPTLNVGAITASTVRGAAGAVITCLIQRVGKLVSITVPAFRVTAQSAAATALILSGAGALPTTYRPSFETQLSVGANTITITAAGVITLTNGTLTLPAGTVSDFNASWVVA